MYDHRIVASYGTWTDARRALRALDLCGFSADRAIVLEEGAVREVRSTAPRSLLVLALEGAARGALRGGVWGVVVGVIGTFVAPPTSGVLSSPLHALLMVTALGYVLGSVIGALTVTRRALGTDLRSHLLDSRPGGQTYKVVVGGTPEQVADARAILAQAPRATELVVIATG